MTRRTTVLLFAAASVAMLLFTVAAAARPGGGSSYSGGGGGGGAGGGFSDGGSDSGGGGLIIFLIQLCFEVPQIGIPLLIVVIGYFVWQSTRKKTTGWESGVRNTASAQSFAPAYAPAPPPPPRGAIARKKLERLREVDAGFSYVLFEDFLYALYAEVHRLRGEGQLARLSPYLAPTAMATFGPGGAAVEDIVIGAMRLVRADGDGGRVRVIVRFDANFTERTAQSTQAYYVSESWTLGRNPRARSRTPDKTRIFACPSCGAPLEAIVQGTCSHCQKQVANGEFDWIVEQAYLEARETRGPMLTQETEEEGTDLPTIVDPEGQTMARALATRDPTFDWAAFQSRVALVFQEFQTAWAARDLAKMRPFLSDNLFQQQTYWVETYKRQHLRNVTENARIANIVLARVTTDAFFDAITVRLYASSLDYTLADDGRLVCGSRNKARRYTEYWTLIRGSSRTGRPRTDPACPNCGGPLNVNMAGVCMYCKAKVTTGEFDWVLSRIEQDEVYEG